ncbi:MAG TPA: rhodanese-like domain-containing protein [Candidatus Binataceae bacterium]|nr:rhodanese-like domain-containing protein [Candidatus Binataceae bacterium]
MKQLLCGILLAALGATVTSAYAGDHGDYYSGAAGPGPQFIVEANHLPELLAQPGVVLLAAASQDETGPLGYASGAVLVDEDAWANFSFSADNLIDYPAWSQMIGQLGIGAGTRVLVYDDGELKFAARIRFLLAHYGVDASLVNGGFAAMQPLIAAGLLHAQDQPSPPVPRAYTAHEAQQPIPMMFRDDVAAAALSSPLTAALLDVRTAGEFDGTVLIAPDTRGGHIPGAQNLPIAEFLAPDNPTELMSPEELSNFLTSAGFSPDQRIIVYCQDGAKSSLAALALLNAGFRHFELYYLSYRNWQADSRLPVDE